MTTYDARCFGLQRVVKVVFFFLLTLLYFRSFERGIVWGLKTVHNYKIGPLLAELGSYCSEWRVFFGSGE
jgi:hypothetical protein